MHEGAKENFNSRAQGLISKVVELREPPLPEESAPALSSSHKKLPIIDLAEIGAIPKNLIMTDTDSGELYEIYLFQGGKFLGLRDEAIHDFKKLVESLSKKLTWISSYKAQELLIEWVVINSSTKSSQTFVEYLDDWKDKHVRAFNFHFPIPNLIIEHPFYVGDVAISYNTEESIDQFLSKSKYPPADPIQLQLKQRFVGNVVAICGFKDMELIKAREVAFSYCEKVVDVLKLYSLTIQKPNKQLSFNLGPKALESSNGDNVLVIEMSNDDTEEFRTINLESHRISKPMRHKITIVDIDKMNKDGFGYFHKFLLNYNREVKPSELETLISQSISRFADALSTLNLHKRIVEIFTCLESLVLRDQSAGIKEALKTYVPKLITKDIEARKKCKTILSNLYDIRSGFIHHGKAREIKLDDLQLLQLYLRILLIKYIGFSFDTEIVRKQEILDKVDEAINEAY